MEKQYVASALIALVLASAPLSPAQARGWDHHGGGWGHGGEGHYGRHEGGGLFYGLFAAGAAVTGAAVALATAPFAIIADAASPGPEAYAPAPVYTQQYYEQPAPVYYEAPPQRVVYSYPRAYAYPSYSYPTYGYPAYGYPQ